MMGIETRQDDGWELLLLIDPSQNLLRHPRKLDQVLLLVLERGLRCAEPEVLLAQRWSRRLQEELLGEVEGLAQARQDAQIDGRGLRLLPAGQRRPRRPRRGSK